MIVDKNDGDDGDEGDDADDGDEGMYYIHVYIIDPNQLTTSSWQWLVDCIYEVNFFKMVIVFNLNLYFFSVNVCTYYCVCIQQCYYFKSNVAWRLLY